MTDLGLITSVVIFWCIVSEVTNKVIAYRGEMADKMLEYLYWYNAALDEDDKDEPPKVDAVQV
jgi:hypothetical protein